MSIRIRVCAFLSRDDEVLLVKHEKESREYWLLPGGGVEQGEDLHQAIIRELKEETSLDVKPRQLLFVCESISPEGRHVLHVCFKCDQIGGDLKVHKDERLKDALFFDKNELAKLTIYPNITSNLIEFLTDENETKNAEYLGNLWH